MWLWLIIHENKPCIIFWTCAGGNSPFMSHGGERLWWGSGCPLELKHAIIHVKKHIVLELMTHFTPNLHKKPEINYPYQITKKVPVVTISRHFQNVFFPKFNGHLEVLTQIINRNKFFMTKSTINSNCKLLYDDPKSWILHILAA